MSSNSPTAVTAHTIIDKLCRDNVHVRPQTDGGPAGMGTARSRAVLRRAWGVLNKWALEILTERGTIDVPNFVRVGWQRFRRLDGQVMPATCSLRVRLTANPDSDAVALIKTHVRYLC